MKRLVPTSGGKGLSNGLSSERFLTRGISLCTHQERLLKSSSDTVTVFSGSLPVGVFAETRLSLSWLRQNRCSFWGFDIHLRTWLTTLVFDLPCFDLSVYKLSAILFTCILTALNVSPRESGSLRTTESWMKGLDHDNHTAQRRQGEELIINLGSDDYLHIKTLKNHAGREARKMVSTKGLDAHIAWCRSGPWTRLPALNQGSLDTMSRASAAGHRPCCLKTLETLWAPQTH
jgi:hypothetical protein